MDSPDAAPDAPYLLRDPATVAARIERLREPHIAPLTEYVIALREAVGDPEGVPWFDPGDGGVGARVLVLLEAPGPKAVGSGFVSTNNPDQTARNLWDLIAEVRLRRDETLLWNIVPGYVGAADRSRIRAVRPEEVSDGARHLAGLLNLLPRLTAVVTLGQPAARGWVKVAPEVRARYTVRHAPHPSPLSLNTRPEARGAILDALRAVCDTLPEEP